MQIKRAEPSEYSQIETLAREIWTDHYTPIIGPAQVTYMLEKFQSVAAMTQQISEGYEYYVIEYDEGLVGYLSIRNETEQIFLSKVYVHKSMRGKGFGRAALEFVEQMAMDRNFKSVRLTVNKFNTNSIAAYEKLGYEKNRALVMDIGQGYVMDDFEMIKQLL